MKIIYVLIFFWFLTSCNLFTKKDDNKLKFSEYEREMEIYETKKFNYINELLHYKNGYDKDTIKLVLKEYYKSYKHFSFNEKSKLLKYNLQVGEGYLVKFDFINKLEKKYSLKRKDLFLITNEIDIFFRTEKLDELETISEEVQDINSHFNEN
jgi:hypothetical protein